jgi:hypothetical protein
MRVFYKIELIVIFVCLVFIGNSQISTRLDEKNGFKDFQIGDLFWKWQANLKFISSTNETKKYRYIGTCCQNVFSYDVKDIVLEFKSDKLVNIFIILKEWEKSTSTEDFTDLSICVDDLKKLSNNFQNLFGNYSDFETDKRNGTITYSWIGRKIALTCGIKYLGIREGCEPFVVIGDLTVFDSGF